MLRTSCRRVPITSYTFMTHLLFRFLEEPHEKCGTMTEIKEDIADEVGSECDREVSKIDFSGVTMRSKKMRAVEENMPRPMSWEGELSDSEMKQVMAHCQLLFFTLYNKQGRFQTQYLMMFRMKTGLLCRQEIKIICCRETKM